MQDAHERRQELARDIPRGHAHVARNAAAERMVRDVKPAMVEIKPESLHHRLPQRLLPLYRKWRIERLLRPRLHPFLLPRHGLRDEAFEKGLELGEDRR